MIGSIKKICPKPMKGVLKRLLKAAFKNKLEIARLNSEIDALKFQIEYFKHHCDIRQMKPATGYLREYQLKELAFTQKILKMLEPYDVKPFVDGGALLGACRHGGFIPWDDDIDLGIMRQDFNKIIEIAKKDFVWIDSLKKDCFSAKFYDMAIRENPNKYVFILTPFCLHLFHGTCLRDSVNLEFFPYDFLREDITEEQYIAYREKICNFVHTNRTWKEKLEFYEKEFKSNNIYSQEQTKRIVPGLGNFDLTEYKFHGFRNYEDLSPLQTISFEGTKLPCPNNTHVMLDKLFGKNWMQFPNDVGISRTLQEQNLYLKSIGTPIDYSEF